jgi:hypothetical protein
MLIMNRRSWTSKIVASVDLDKAKRHVRTLEMFVVK